MYLYSLNVWLKLTPLWLKPRPADALRKSCVAILTGVYIERLCSNAQRTTSPATQLTTTVPRRPTELFPTYSGTQTSISHERQVPREWPPWPPQPSLPPAQNHRPHQQSPHATQYPSPPPKRHKSAMSFTRGYGVNVPRKLKVFLPSIHSLSTKEK